MSSGSETYSTGFGESPSVVVDDVSIHGRLNTILTNFVLEEIYNVLGIGQNPEGIRSRPSVKHLVATVNRTSDTSANGRMTEDLLCCRIVLVPMLICIAKDLRNVYEVDLPSRV